MNKWLATTLVTSLLAAPAAEAMEIRINPQQPQAGEPFSMTIVGSWRDGCLPSLTEVNIENGEIILVGRVGPVEACFSAIRPLMITVPPVDLQRLDSGVYRARFVVDESDTIGTVSVEATLLFEVASADVNKLIPESGAWWPEPGGQFETSGPGVGLSLEAQGDVLVATLNAYDENGLPEWWIAAGKLGQRVFRATRVRVAGGQPLFAPYQPIDSTEEIGNLSIEFLSPGRATLSLEQPAEIGGIGGYRQQTLSISRFLFASHPGAESWLGDWLVSLDDDLGSSRRIRFSIVNWAEDGNSYQLLNETEEATLSCVLDGGRRDVLPASCQLHHADLPLVDLPQVGLSRLRGNADEGSSAVMLRVDP